MGKTVILSPLKIQKRLQLCSDLPGYKSLQMAIQSALRKKYSKHKIKAREMKTKELKEIK